MRIELSPFACATRPIAWLAVLATACLGQGFSSAAWAADATLLQVAPEVQSSSLGNGMRVVLMQQDDGSNRLAIRLHLEVGSIDEADDEQGLTHLLEHVAFRGSAASLGSEPMAVLQRLGMQMGADANALTSAINTVYRLDLPDTRDATLTTAFKLLRADVDPLALSSADFESERKVVQAEAQLSKNPTGESGRETLRFIMASQRVAERLPIGKDAVIAQVSVCATFSCYG
jgi:zinc protease